MGDHPKDPRNYLSRHTERGSAQIPITLRDVADQFDLSMSAVYAERSRLQDMDGIARFVSARRGRLSEEVPEEEAAQLMSRAWGTPDQWLCRWPRLRLWRCGHHDCSAVSFTRGLCPKCGGFLPIVAIRGGEIMIRTDRYRKLARLIMGNPTGSSVQRIDENRWNLHPSNLKIIASGGS